MSWLSAAVYQANMVWIRTLFLWAADRDIKGRENVPRRGPFILTSNHLNNVDPPLLADALPRQIAWLTKAEWFKTPGVGQIFRIAGMIPVRRFEADLHALRECQAALGKGLVLGMFPEGTRSRTGVLQQGEPGSAIIALRSGAPILPAAIWGSEHVKLPRDLIRRTRIHIRFGEPYTLPRNKRITRQDAEEGTALIMKRIAALLPAKYRGVYAGETAGSTRAAAGTE